MKLKKLTILGLISIFALAFTITPSQEAINRDKDIVSVALNTSNLSTLVKAVKAADLGEILSDEGPFTVFAPSDQAFEDLPDGELEKLMEEGNKKMLRRMLTYHVLPAKVMFSDLKDGQTAKTVEGTGVTISLKDKTAMINSAKVVKADVKTSNGVVHIIDSVMMPMNKKKKDMDYDNGDM